METILFAFAIYLYYLSCRDIKKTMRVAIIDITVIMIISFAGCTIYCLYSLFGN